MKLNDLQYLVKSIDDRMPLHSEECVKIPHTFGKLPKNLLEYSAKVNAKFLDNHLCEIEDVKHFFPEHDLPKWLKNYQRKQYLKSGMLNHDGFFTHDPENGLLMPKNTHFILTNMNTTAYKGGIIGGPDLLSADPNDGNNNLADGTLWANKLTLGTIGLLYDQIAANIHTSSGNVRMGFYDDSSIEANNLMAETASTATPSANFTTELSLTETALVTTLNWAALEFDNGTARCKAKNVSVEARLKTFTYGVLPDPYASTTTNNFPLNMRLSHT